MNIDYPADLDLPYEHLLIVAMSLARGQWYVKVLDRRTGFQATAGGSGASPGELVAMAWKRLCSAKLTGDLYEPF